jgi:hypothetical protein
MASNVTNRSVIRKAVATLLEAGLVDEDDATKPVGEVVLAIPSDMKSGTTVAVSSRSSDRKKLANRDVISKSSFFINVYVYVATTKVVDEHSVTVWDEYSAEDQIDLVEKMIADIIIDNNIKEGTWMQISYAEKTNADYTIVTEEYRRETIPLFVEVENG